MNDNFKLDIAYIAGLFDAKGTVGQRNKVWKMEMAMTDRNLMELFHETLECGILRERKLVGNKKHWRWTCLGKECLFVARLLWAHTTVKLHKIEQIIDHYDPDIQDVDDNLVDLALEREKRR
tara:strand:+ start:90 stop:455 length:366 start_codon:yes stop_codon:yes gene_type:complete